MLKIRRPNIEHCLQPRGYPRKIFLDVLTNMHTTKGKILQFSGADLSLPNIYICVPENHNLPSKIRKLASLGAHGVQTVHPRYLSF